MPVDQQARRPRQALLLGLVGVVIFGLTCRRRGWRCWNSIRCSSPLRAVRCWRRCWRLSRCCGRGRSHRGGANGRRLAWFAVCSIVGFPLLMTIAMQHAPASHGAVVLAVLPLLTAMAGALVAGERPSLGFWACGVAGTAAVLALRPAVRRRFRRSAMGRSAAGGGRAVGRHGLCARRRDGAPHRRLGGDLLGAGVSPRRSCWRCYCCWSPTDQLGRLGRRPGPASSTSPCSASSSVSSPGTRAWRWAASPGSARCSCCSRSWRCWPPGPPAGRTHRLAGDLSLRGGGGGAGGARLAHAGRALAMSMAGAPWTPQFRVAELTEPRFKGTNARARQTRETTHE